MNIRVTSTLSKHIQLPYRLVKGTVEDRNNYARSLTNTLLCAVKQKVYSRDISLATLRKILNDSKPKKVPLYIEVNDDSTARATLNTIMSDNNEKIIGFKLGVNVNESGNVSRIDLPTIAHELQHFADFLYHPKILAREQKLRSKNLYNHKYEQFYDKWIYVGEEFKGKKDKRKVIKCIKHKFEKFLRRLSTEDKINYLQYIRYCLTMEDKAYRTQRKVGKNLYKKNFEVYEFDIENLNTAYMFQEKINLLKNMIFSLIKKEREIHKVKLNKE